MTDRIDIVALVDGAITNLTYTSPKIHSYQLYPDGRLHVRLKAEHPGDITFVLMRNVEMISGFRACE